METQNQFLVSKQPLKEQYGFKTTYHIVIPTVPRDLILCPSKMMQSSRVAVSKSENGRCRHHYHIRMRDYGEGLVRMKKSRNLACRHPF